MAVLTSTGIIFGGSGGTLNSKYGIIPQSTPMLFLRAAAPTGWSQVTSDNDKALRVVSGTGGVAGGTNAFTNTLVNQPMSANVPVTINGLSAGGVSLTTATIPIHPHPANNGGSAGGSGVGGGFGAPSSTGVLPTASTTGNYGNSGTHAHPITYTSANGPGAVTLDFRTQYVDVIICTLS
jgi:hypothetical protein